MNRKAPIPRARTRRYRNRHKRRREHGKQSETRKAATFAVVENNFFRHALNPFRFNDRSSVKLRPDFKSILFFGKGGLAFLERLIYKGAVSKKTEEEK